MNLTELPWRLVRKTFYSLRKEFFTLEKSYTDLTLPNTTAEEAKDILRKENFGNGTFFSYRYTGEDYNLYRPEYVNDKWEEYQTHIRIFRKIDGNGNEYCGLNCHFEIDPRSSGQARPHLKAKNFSKKRGIENAKEILDKHNVEYKE